ncbi:ABC transporter substrate-binding protein [Mycobacterium sp. 236(2023)]|uniref:ABC transporter substrate-binding protein n=1 Tax=Mycobacterium sp. 236(2023) TaxID=3038163 RepID=UPI00241555FB|nr:ABC transporter substrate-binding protein [Mycobacterium sp. 236(2023)]MDG4666981.1 ABC transporter substrate-binding protein [Mycobacterium sp. 236(2023)]
MRARTTVALLLVMLLTACGSGGGTEAGEGGWSYLSGDGKTYTAEQVPTRIIAQGEAAAALMSFGIKPVGVFLNEPLEDSKALAGVNLDGVEILGETWGQIDVERAAALRPDLIVSAYWPVEEAYGGLEEGVEESAKKVGELAQVVGPTTGESVQTMLDGFEQLAISLGADVGSPDIAKDKADFAAARDRFSQAVAAKPGLVAMAASPTDELLYVAVPEHAAELTDFSDWGMDVLVPRDPDPAFPYWENLSWENADKYQPDLILFDDRTYDSAMAAADRQPTWKRIEAVQAGAITPWPAFWISTWASYADQLNRLSDAVDKADPDLT